MPIEFTHVAPGGVVGGERGPRPSVVHARSTSGISGTGGAVEACVRVSPALPPLDVNRGC